jgi:hypothetical protein
MERLEANIRKANNAQRQILWQSQAEKIELARIKNLPNFKKQKIVDNLNLEICQLEQKMAYCTDFEVVQSLLDKIKDKNLTLAKYLFN